MPHRLSKSLYLFLKIKNPDLIQKVLLQFKSVGYDNVTHTFDKPFIQTFFNGNCDDGFPYSPSFLGF